MRVVIQNYCETNTSRDALLLKTSYNEVKNGNRSFMCKPMLLNKKTKILLSILSNNYWSFML